MNLPFEEVKRSVVVKQAATSDSQYGGVPSSRTVDVAVQYGIVNVNKPAGPTSHQVAEFVQKVLGIDRAGHGGTLDPGVTGVLVVALGRATRVAQFLLPAGKEYVGILRLHAPVEEKQLRSVIDVFVGKIMQLPPVRSAVVRKLRERSVYYFEVLEVNGQEVLFRVGVQAGTYIRKLCHDIGVKLGVGAHMAQLVRTKAGPFSFDTTVTLQDLEDAVYYWKEKGNDTFLKKLIVPVESAVVHMPKVWIQDSAVDAVCHGATLHVPGVVKYEVPLEKGDIVAILSLKDELVAIGESHITGTELKTVSKGVVAKTSRVFMLAGTYPKFKKDSVKA